MGPTLPLGSAREKSSASFRKNLSSFGMMALACAVSLEQLIESDLDPGPTGKGRNLWLCFGYVLASGKSHMVAVHDCDILTYTRDLLARLCYPVAHPNLGFDFCKGLQRALY